ncbi:acyl-CoA dehydrogenase family protein [Rhizorhabdus dicambivorans]|uniref:Acyl-[acyl-carrier-protein] dehydrogenase MbtN n=1 Tax=Rhizorhabdus dicambivorans TaxID=1850238 RepID=A0A2A4FQ63_9SPHN|nr:acyl-CoA dehydrogenase family protein [Rhizorhabdus dicambivorans]ATE64261.1 acyl-CoA dehydrogenase [Rhizorhabdus dicambivorans]PCE40553.1 acyl-CoA dehydrogenase [Rhizorhabdus dicambivorans]
MALPYTEEHDMFRRSVRAFVEREIAPHHERWEDEGIVDRDLWRKAGGAGLLLTGIASEYGGGGGDFLMTLIMTEELTRGVFSGPGFRLHSDIVAPYIEHLGTEEQKRRWLPAMASGEMVAAVAMTEPGAGSDLQAIRTTAIRDGDDYVVNGQKTFISNGSMADLVVVAVKTDPAEGARGTSLLVIEAERAGFAKGKRLKKLGLKAQDTAELYFDDVRVPVANRLGEEGKGFAYLMRELPRERLIAAAIGVIAAEAALDWTIDHVKSRKAFGGTLFDLQNTRFVLGELKTEVEIGRTFLDDCTLLLMRGGLDATRAAMAKLWCTELEGRVIDRCLQLFGGYGYMWEYPIARAYADARVHRILAGSNEIMKELVARSL